MVVVMVMIVTVMMMMVVVIQMIVMAIQLLASEYVSDVGVDDGDGSYGHDDGGQDCSDDISCACDGYMIMMMVVPVIKVVLVIIMMVVDCGNNRDGDHCRNRD